MRFLVVVAAVSAACWALAGWVAWAQARWGSESL